MTLSGKSFRISIMELPYRALSNNLPADTGQILVSQLTAEEVMPDPN